MTAAHLTRRFFGSLRPRPLDATESAWVQSHLVAGEPALWARMTTADQRHAYSVAQTTVELLGDDATRAVVAAALLHDVGKIEANIGTFNRVMATFAGKQAGVKQIEDWSTQDGWLGRAGRYLRHHEIGADLLREAGSDPLTVTWAYEHELNHTRWTLPEPITDALWKADNP